MRRWLAERLAPLLGPEPCFRAGEALRARGDFVRAAVLFGKAGRRGHPGACLAVGQLYLNGQGVPPSRTEAARWLLRAATAGHAAAQSAYAAFLWSGQASACGQGLFAAAQPPGQAGSRDIEGAILWAGRAAEAGLPEAQALLAQILCFGPETVRDEARGQALFAQAAAAGRPEGSLGLALLLHRRAGDSPDGAEEVRRLLARAAEGGSPYALFALGVMAEGAATDDTVLRQAAAFYAEAARLGHRGAQARWGVFLVEGLGCPRNTLEGESWLRRAALAGERDAAAWLGDHYARPQGPLPPNPLEAVAWYRRAADLGHGAAARQLGAMYRDGRAGEDARQAAALFRQAAQLGETAALADLQALIAAGVVPAAAMTETIEALPAGQYWYGRHLLRQAALPADQAEARRWIARAADSGMVAARAVLAEMMLHGRGGPRDVAGAVRQFEAAAAEGHLGAIFALGVLYAGVEGVPPDRARSERLLREAAARGHGPAQTELAKFVSRGLYAPADTLPSRMLEDR
jgi:TPR repeat protein